MNLKPSERSISAIIAPTLNTRWKTVMWILLAYTLAFFVLHPLVGSGATSLIMIPVAVCGWLFGSWAGVLAGLIALPYNTFLLNASGETGLDIVFQVGGLPGIVGVTALGFLAGYFHTLNRKLSEQLAENQRARSELISTEARFQTLAENIDEIVWMVTTDRQKTLYVNPVYETITGYPTSTLYANTKNWFDLIHPEDKPHVEKRLQSDDHTLITLEYRIIRKDKNIRWIWHRVKPARDNNGTITAHIITLQDITERIMIEDQAMELTLQKERNEILEKLIKNVSHDFKTPLTNIKLSIYMLKKLKNEENQAQRTEIIAEEVERIRSLVDDMLSMINVDKDALNVESFDINPVLEEVKTRLDALPRKRKITLTLALEDNIPSIEGDREQISLAISHLLTYMMLFSLDGSEIMIHSHADDSDVKISFTDPNMGISPEKLERVFEPFYKIETVRTTAVGRSGLGLAMTKKIIERHDGHVSVESDENTGSVFRVILPIKRRETDRITRTIAEE